MCGRFSVQESAESLIARFGVQGAPPIQFNDDVRPTNQVVIVRNRGGVKEFATARWGLVPADSPTFKGEKSYFNAKGETLHFIKPWAPVWAKGQRCLVPVSSFFEWPILDGVKRKVRISMVDGSPFAFAGIWEDWIGPGSPPDIRTSFTIITCKPSSEMANYHDRMPVIIAPSDYDDYLQGTLVGAKALLRPYPDGQLLFVPI